MVAYISRLTYLDHHQYRCINQKYETYGQLTTIKKKFNARNLENIRESQWLESGSRI